MTDPTTTPPLTPRQDAAVCPLETPAGGDAGAETPESATGAQADRWARREQLGVLLSRMQRGVLLDSERGLLRAAVEAELAAADQARAEAASYGQDADRLRADYARVAGERDALLAERETARSITTELDQGYTQLRDALLAERDRARRIAVELEQELAALPGLLERSYPHDYGAQTIGEHLRGETAWPCETHPKEGA